MIDALITAVLMFGASAIISIFVGFVISHTGKDHD